MAQSVVGIDERRRFVRGLLTVLFAGWLSAGAAQAGTLIEWDFQNPQTSGQISSFVGTPLVSEVSGTASQTGGGPAEYFSTGWVHLTRYFGPVKYPYIEITTSVPLSLEGLTFTHKHNNTQGYPTHPSYSVRLQIDTGAGYEDVGSRITIDQAHYGSTRTASLGVLVDPGTFRIRWMSGDLAYGEDTRGNFFALLDVTVSGVVLRDADDDGVLNVDDNCPDVPNPEQNDTDLDGAGDACDADDDNDGVPDGDDNCAFTPNAGQIDLDGDGLGDPCDADVDGDTICDDPAVPVGCAGGPDNCPTAPNPYQDDTDLDGQGDACDEDDDDDGICDTDQDGAACTAGPDNCATVVNPAQDDFDGDGIGDVCDADVDGDGIDNDVDNCMWADNASQDDTDLDGDGDACDPDDDGDSVLDGADNCPLVYNLDQDDLDGDGIGDACDADLDGDGVDNGFDNCPTVANSGQADLDDDGLGDACDPDIDGDGVLNASDLCSATPASTLVDPGNGCSIAQLCPCAGPRGTNRPWKNHGKYVSCVAHATEGFLELGLITEAEKDALVSEAAQSDCGHK